MDEYQAPLGDVFDVPQPTVGEAIRRARIQKGMELVDIARETRVPIRHLHAIESDAHDSLPALPYAVGFVKSFARHVGLAPNLLAAQFRTETTKGEHVPVVVAPLEPIDDSRKPSLALIAGTIVALVVLIAVVWAYGAGRIAPRLSETPVAPAGVAATPESAPAPAPVIDITLPPAAGTIAEVRAEPAALAPPTGDVPVDVAPAGGQVMISATEDAWFKVYDANGTVKMGILQAGESYAVPAEPTGLKLWTGNAGALRLTVGGKPVAAIGGAKQTIKDVSLVPADLLGRPSVQP